MKNIVFVIESLNLGGAEKSLVTLLQNLDYSRYNVDLITFKKKGIFREFVPEGVNCISINFPKLSLLDRIKYALYKIVNSSQHNAQLFWSIIQYKFEKLDKTYDIAIAYNQGFATYYVHQYIGAPIKYAWLNTDYKKAGYSINFDYPIYKKFESIVAVSYESRRGLEEELKTIEKQLPIVIIEDIVDQKIVQQQANMPPKNLFDKNIINIVSVGRLVEYKGFHLAIKACKILLDKGYPIKWYLIGEGSGRKKIEKLIKKNNLENYFILLGADSNPYPYMKNATIYVQTSLFEGLGLTVIEASYLCKPIVSTNFPTIFGIIKEEETGLVAKMNAEHISKQIERLILNEGLRNRFTNNLLKQANSDKEEYLEKIYNLF